MQLLYAIQGVQEILCVMEEIEITYKVGGCEEAGETSFDMEISEKQYERLSDADDEGELLDSDFLSEEMPGIHKKILKAIRENMEEESLNPDDGKVEKTTCWGARYKEYSSSADHSLMEIADDEDIEYEVSLY